MLTGVNPSITDEVNRQSSAITKRREQLRRWDESETNRQSSNIKISQRVKFEQAYIFLAACSSEDQDEIDRLLQRNVDINTSNIDGLTALHQACIDNNLHMVEYLINKNANINCQDNEGWTPLHAAASCTNINIVKYLLSRGAIVDICNNEGELPIDIAEDDDIINYLKDDMNKKGIDDQQSRNYEHQLMIKHAQDLFNNNKYAFKSSIDSIIHPRTGATPLHVAASKGYLDVIDLLIRANANINSIDKDGWTPLHAAAHWDKHDVIIYLIDKNANLDAKNYAGQTPLDVCDGETFKLLKELKEKQKSISYNENIEINLSNINDIKSNISTSNSSSSLSSRLELTKPFQSINCENSSYQSFDSKTNRSINQIQSEIPSSKRWGSTNDRTVGDISNNNIPYIRRRSSSDINELNTPISTAIVSITSSPPSPTANVTVTTTTTTSNTIDESKRRINHDEEAEAQRKHRSAQARRERRSTQGVSIDDIKAAEQQIKNQPINQIGAPLTNNEHDIDTEHLQKLIQDNKEKIRRDINHRISPDNSPTIIANDSINLANAQQQRRKTNRVHNNQRKNTGRIIWNDETKEVEYKDDSSPRLSHEEGLDDHQSIYNNSRNLISRFENNPITRINRSQSQEPLIKSIQNNNDLTINKLYEDTKRKFDELNIKFHQLTNDIIERDKIIEKLKTSQYIESSIDKREKRSFERKISELEEELKRMDSIKSDNTRLKEENAALIRVISKLSK